MPRRTARSASATRWQAADRDRSDLRGRVQLGRALLRRVEAAPRHDADRLSAPAARAPTIRFAVGECSLGAILVAASEAGVCAILLGDDPGCARARSPGSLPARVVRRRRSRVRAHRRQGRRLRRATVGRGSTCRSTFAARRFSSGSGTRCARSRRDRRAATPTSRARIGAPAAARGVARACAANPLAVAIPCHRVVRRDGGLSGYRWGVERKRGAA